VPVWATLIALMEGTEVVVGVASAPALTRRWWAALGGGAWTGRSLTKASRCQVSGVSDLADASLSYSGLGGWGARQDYFLSAWPARSGGPCFGDFWSHVLVAEGAVDIAGGAEVSLWDLAALQINRGGGRRGVHRPGRQGHAGRRQRGVHQRPAARRGAPPPDPGQVSPARTGPNRPAPRAPYSVRVALRAVIADAEQSNHMFTSGKGEAMKVRDGMTTVVLTVGPAHTCAKRPA